MELKSVLKKPIVTEKAALLSSQLRYVFEVDKRANKTEIKKAVEKYFNVKVDQVKTLAIKGKKRRVLKTKKETTASDGKKAIVYLKEGNKIDLLETGS